MSRKWGLPLTAACAALAMLAYQSDGTEDRGKPAGPRPVGGMVEPGVATPLGIRDLVSAKDTILGRPLFAEGRAAPRDDLPKPAAPAAQPRLIGIVISPEFRRVVFAAADDEGRPIFAAEGEVVEGWEVARINAGRALLKGPGGPQWVAPSPSLRMAATGAVPGHWLPRGGTPVMAPQAAALLARTRPY